MNVSQEQINELYSAQVVTQDGEKLGGVGQVYLDDHTGEPSWVSVKTGWFGTSESLVPLDGAELSSEGTVRVVPSKDVIKDAPNVDADAHLSAEDQDALFRYYGSAGVNVSRYDDLDTAGTAGTGTHTGGTGDRDAAVGDVMGHQGVHAEGHTTGGDVGSGQRTGDADLHRAGGSTDDGSMTLHEERVDVGTQQVETGRVRLRKHVVTEQENVTVPVQREEVEIVREPVASGDVDAGGRLQDEEAEVTLHEERPVIDKDVVATERVGLQKETVTDEKQVVTDVSHEEVDVDRQGEGLGGTDRDGLGGTDRDGLGGTDRDGRGSGV
ncbi:DUF2382 domain-containing protein [Ornithinimicrobium pratense]|uniref:DUF2382 domain-containing protein n=1 Tax=Ornithinimicrobium pratense TaxID=2593973 RepID=A0A5J6V307_9MICO|nr:PRC and DUF2382 domain-containing protein [Ornithinimicrobium pratense]QFG68057.1 DUF2382 domain-containing protein [Ornithinimicrobium pratense]